MTLIKSALRDNKATGELQLALLQSILSNYDPTTVDATISPTETMTGDNYMWVGAAAADVVIRSVVASHLMEVKTILDLPSGHGRVLRHLVKMFPEAQCDVCDLDIGGMDFCVKQFGARAIPAHSDLRQTAFDRKYDLIWIGSLFTHTPAQITQTWLDYLSRQLTSTGIVVSTFHGRWAIKMQRIIPYLDEDRWNKVLEGYYTLGYGYIDYHPGEVRVDSNYGISVAKPHVLVEMIEKIPGVRIFLYQERGWGENHDVIAFGRPGWET
jgi:methyltransferase family protein